MFHMNVRTSLVCVAVTTVACTAATASTAAPLNPQPLPPGQKSTPAQAIASTKAYEPASVRAKPGLQCKLHPPGTATAKGLPVATDSDGYARFYAVRAREGKAAQRLTLDCTDASGRASSYPVDLASANTFAARRLKLAAEPGKERPRLAGNPMHLTQAHLIQQGYGLRPDPKTSPGAYERWLAAARVTGRMLDAKKPNLRSHTATSQSAPSWAGAVITGAPTYAAVEGTFNVPTATPGGDQTGTTEVAIWNGLGGFGTGSGLIQSGVNLYTTSNAAAYGTWREYCCGDPYSNGYGGAFTPNPGDEIYAENWYCDAVGNIDVNGGYGCSYLVDLQSGAVLNCTAANGSPCWSVPAIAGMTFGPAAEFIIENQSPQVSNTSTAFTDFSPAVTMTGTAYSTQTNSFSQNIGNDPSLQVLTDFTNTTSHIVVSTTDTPATVFTMEATQPSYPLYCQGPLETTAAQVPTPTTVFKWASNGAGAEPPGPGECAWADRPPRPGEEQPGGTGIIFGYLNQVTNLPAGTYSEIGVYRDPAFGNDLNVTQIVGFVSPPFSANPVLP
jgi:Peptidase A4 family